MRATCSAHLSSVNECPESIWWDEKLRNLRHKQPNQHFVFKPSLFILRTKKAEKWASKKGNDTHSYHISKIHILSLLHTKFWDLIQGLGDWRCTVETQNNLTVTNMPETETRSRFHTSKALSVHKRPRLRGLLLHFTFRMPKVRRFSSWFGEVLTISLPGRFPERQNYAFNYFPFKNVFDGNKKNNFAPFGVICVCPCFSVYLQPSWADFLCKAFHEIFKQFAVSVL